MVRMQGDEDSPETGGKRSRAESSSSSPDFKEGSFEQLLTETMEGSSSSSSAHEANEQQQQWSNNRHMNPTRSRRSSGIPKQSQLQLEDLAGLSKEELLEALHNNPVLTAQLQAAAAAEEQQQESMSNTGGGTGSTRRGSSKTYVKPGDRAKSLKEQGVPYQQWGILLFLLGVAVYQLYKSSVPSKSQGKARKSSLKSAPTDDAVVAALEGSVAKAASSNTKKTKKKKQSAVKSAPKAFVVAAENTVTASPIRSAMPLPQAVVDDAQDDGEWKTVAKSNKPAEDDAQPVAFDDTITERTSNTMPKKKKKNGASPPPADDSAPMVAEIFVVHNEPESGPLTETKPVEKTNGSTDHTISPPLVNGTPEQQAPVKRKSIKKKKAKNGNAPVTTSGGTVTTEADAALALQLQQEEDQLAAAVQEVRLQDMAASNEEIGGATTTDPNGGEEPDAWAEVTKKKKQPPPPSEAAPEPDATTPTEAIADTVE